MREAVVLCERLLPRDVDLFCFIALILTFPESLSSFVTVRPFALIGLRPLCELLLPERLLPLRFLEVARD